MNIANEFEEVSCPICHANDPELLHKIGMFGLPANFSLCKNCGFGYLNPRWTKERYDYFYAKEYDTHYRVEEETNQRLTIIINIIASGK